MFPCLSSSKTAVKVAAWNVKPGNHFSFLKEAIFSAETSNDNLRKKFSYVTATLCGAVFTRQEIIQLKQND